MNKNFIGLVIVLAGLALIFWLAKPTPPSGSSDDTTGVSGALSAEETVFDFGSISMANGKVGHVFTIKNASTSPVVINKMYTSCMCTTAELNIDGRSFGPYGMPGHMPVPMIKETIEAGARAQVEVIFDPNAHGPAGVGLIDREVIIENSSEIPFKFKIKGIVTP